MEVKAIEYWINLICINTHRSWIDPILGILAKKWQFTLQISQKVQNTVKAFNMSLDSVSVNVV